jgi:hypothetical protein
MLKVILIAGVVILAMPFLVFGALAVFAGLSLSRFRRTAGSVRAAQPDSGGQPPEESG